MSEQNPNQKTTLEPMKILLNKLTLIKVGIRQLN